MNSKEVILKLYDSWLKHQREMYSSEKEFESDFSEYNESEKRAMFLSEYIVGITTYDGNLSLKFGKMIIETLEQIKNKTTYEYIENELNYEKYILSCNFIERWLDWGTSIRGAWFNTYDGKIETDEYLGNVGCDKEFINITEDFISWFVDWLLCKM